jgi:hypothetical protein
MMMIRWASLALAALALTAAVTGCGSLLPLGPYVSPTGHLSEPITLQPVLSQAAPPPAGGCQTGYVTASAASGSPGPCFRKTGTPVTFSSAAVTLYLQPAGGQRPAIWGLAITVSGAEAAALTAITSRSSVSGDPLAISIGGTTWTIVSTTAPLTNGRFQIMTQSKNQALQLQRVLVPSD